MNLLYILFMIYVIYYGAVLLAALIVALCPIDLSIEAQLEKVDRIVDIMKFGVMSTPALVVDGVVKSTGRVLSPEDIQKLLA